MTKLSLSVSHSLDNITKFTINDVLLMRILTFYWRHIQKLDGKRDIYCKKAVTKSFCKGKFENRNPNNYFLTLFIDRVCILKNNNFVITGTCVIKTTIILLFKHDV